MFSYYGTKRRLAHHYPEPDYDVIIEPFCGAAAYSLYGDHWTKQVKLYDVSRHVVAAWRWLIAADQAKVMALPILKPGERLDRYILSPGAATFLGFMISASTRNPKKTATERTTWSPTSRSRIAETIGKVEHWTVDLRSFERIDNQEATWFVDPPYEAAGKWYDNTLDQADYTFLGCLCKSGWLGQVIACDMANASWLPFQPLVEARGQSNNTDLEGIYHRSSRGL